jgi:hypothetical protein
MDCTIFKEFIKQSDNDNNSNQEAKVEYHIWRLLTDEISVERGTGLRDIDYLISY